MDKNKLALYLFVLILGFAIGIFIIKGHFSPQVLGILAFCLIFIPTLVNPDIGLIILIVFIMFSPEIIAGATSQREISIRTEDILLLVVVLAWFLKTTFTKNIAGAFNTVMTRPFLLYIGVCVFSTTFAALFGTIDVRHSFFSILKYMEYFILFIMVKDNMKSMRQARIFILVFILTALFVAIRSHAFIQQEIASGESFFRVAPPVETRGGGEAGTLGGYLLFMMAIAGGFLMYEESVFIRGFLIVLELLMFRAFLYTLSRGSYLALAAMAVAFVCFVKKGRLALFYVLIAAGLLVTMFAPQMVKERIANTVTTIETEKGVSRMDWEESPRARIISWKDMLFVKLPRSPLLGYGVGKFFIDSQIFLTLSEAGLIGLAAFFWVLVTFYRMAKGVIDVDIVKNDKFSAGLSIGFLMGFIGLLFHAISTNTFIIIQIMEPFWFIAAIVVSLPDLLRQERESAEGSPAAA